ncbi:Similar to Histone-lysine N-methyltransferase, H3 lysine-9 specific SUVH5; acc. no. O82175 [Pyronema omphalodes CBS 100304]|uniref:Similar to Histone-lysine N-methyltransferase, H3 lysine-9 specific SUVH5 acc. no. O82175 n=1 Tax=Pyronema omphalodes (strain CBS 100304) TaxID=1076935 RepID=U4LPQ1_PYROM|nr:Similar to Histone-lysine N-methyltransferase, H3 lysine-9 specific SUVH5; acc. no. O82175 [Pyronema omphalodes CBS 100304]
MEGHSRESALSIKAEDCYKYCLYAHRARINNIHKRLRALQSSEGAAFRPSHISVEDNESLLLSLNNLAVFRWPADPMPWYNQTKIGTVVKNLINLALYSPDIVDMATELFKDRWEKGDFAPRHLEADPEHIMDENERSISEGKFFRPVGPEWNDMVRYIARGLLRRRHPRGMTVWRLDHQFPRRSPKVYGHNGLTVGDWWPYQLCLLRDGAHGSSQGGISGDKDLGAYSIVVSCDNPAYRNGQDHDTGEVLFYSGTSGPAVVDGDTSAVLTNANAIMKASVYTQPQRPVRVIRKGPSPKGGLYPCSGFRYDGLYLVTEMKIVEADEDDKRDFYQFKLVRMPGQPSLQSIDRPTNEEYAAHLELQNW